MAFSFSQPQQSSLFQTPAAQPSQPFQFQQNTPNPFQQQQQQQQQPQQQQSPFQFQFQPQQPQPQFQPQQPQQQQQQQILLYTVEKTPASYNTKWADLHPDSQKFLLQIEERVQDYRDESQRLDQCSRLYDSSVFNDGFELDASYIVQELGGIGTAMEREKILVQEQMASVNNMMRDTEVAVRSFIMLRQRFLHPSVSTTTNTSSASQTTGAAVTPSQNSQPQTSMIPAFDFYSGVPRRPSPFMQQTVARFEKYLAECSQWLEELEQLLRLDADGTVSSSGISSLQSLPSIMSNVHDYFVHVTAKVESLHQRIESMKAAYLADQRRRGDWNDPFLEADRRETAKQEAAARRVHPTLHLPAVPSQPATQVAGLAAGSALPQLSLGMSGASASGLSSFSNPSSPLFAGSITSSPFSTPTTSFTVPLFGSSVPSPKSTPFGSATSPMFGHTQPGPHFGSTTSSFATPGIGNSPAFSTPPFASGAATGSGASFGGASKSAKPKSRTARR